jgi:hypothetical protein
MKTLIAAWLALSVPALAAESIPALKNGADCAKSKPPAREGETHRCYFDPGVRQKWDFGTRNGRAQFLFSKLGPECDVMEILADEPVAGSPDPAAPLRRVSVLCEG